MVYRVTPNEDVKRHWNFPSKKRDKGFDRWFDKANANSDNAPENSGHSYQELVDMDRNTLGLDSLLTLQHNDKQDDKKPYKLIDAPEKTGLARYKSVDVDPDEAAMAEYIHHEDSFRQLSFSFDD